MPFFDYRAVDQTGRNVRGTLSAVNDVDLELRLKRMGLDLITLSELSRQYAPQGRDRVTRRDLVTFCIHMRYITRAGIPLLEGLRDLRDSMDKRGFRDVLTALLEDLEGGKVLSQALAAHPAVFGAVFVHSVKAGEQTGLLDAVFERLAESLKWQEEVAAKARRLMIYPLLVLAVVGAAILFLLIYLVPQVLTLVETMGVVLPLPTLILMAVSEAVRSYWLIGLLLAFALGVGVPLWVTKNEAGRAWWDRAQLRLPVVGPIVKKIVLSRFTNTLAMMYRSGVSVLDALRAGEMVAGNRLIAEGIRRAGQQIAEGRGLSESFHSLALFPPLVIRMLRVGETTGALDEALDNVTYFYNREVLDSIENGLRVLEPMLTAILGLLLGGILVSVLLPIYDLIGNLPL
ncbi:type IV pilus assembly protein PilC [Thiobacillus denitrificans ATCC 25259]|uniref:Type IV pilus assembly protein PilC n=1 Tax=Thiobacillus denitrificans (strain ATCC 25259 / T1) TaxID=292415 RepID=Q3SLB6_THIDA|nr:type II secretion system F family protein [Thiobacillus denitrificans]AAZ96499.1 type IV pilus assembly protein PilC [Thiobacillus denitrificans ATCC 25259]